MNTFGGEWTKIKIEIVVKYAKAYLTIMNKYPRWKTLYFDALAGSGKISNEVGESGLNGTALSILEIGEPKPFDIYYFVDKNAKAIKELESLVVDNYHDNRTVFCVHGDCNQKIKDLGKYLKSVEGKNTKVLGYFDPFGMQIDWESVSSLSELDVDVWMLIPSGIGVNRLLTKTGKIDVKWQKTLERFLGLNIEEIRAMFYRKNPQKALFGESGVLKNEEPIEMIINLYQSRLNEVFKYVSVPLPLRNKTNSIMYHFMMMTNNGTALKIANQIIRKYR